VNQKPDYCGKVCTKQGTALYSWLKGQTLAVHGESKVLQSLSRENLVEMFFGSRLNPLLVI